MEKFLVHKHRRYLIQYDQKRRTHFYLRCLQPEVNEIGHEGGPLGPDIAYTSMLFSPTCLEPL